MNAMDPNAATFFMLVSFLHFLFPQEDRGSRLTPKIRPDPFAGSEEDNEALLIDNEQ